MSTPIEKLRQACLKRGVSGIKTMGRYLAQVEYLTDHPVSADVLNE